MVKADNIGQVQEFNGVGLDNPCSTKLELLLGIGNKAIISVPNLTSAPETHASMIHDLNSLEREGYITSLKVVDAMSGYHTDYGVELTKKGRVIFKRAQALAEKFFQGREY